MVRAGYPACVRRSPPTLRKLGFVTAILAAAVALWFAQAVGHKAPLLARDSTGTAAPRDTRSESSSDLVAAPSPAVAARSVSPVASTPPSAEISSPTLADVLAETGDLSVPANRARAVERMREIENGRRLAAVSEASRRGLPVRVERPDGTVQELVAFEEGRPVYFTTHNVNAAISTGARALQASPYGLAGSGVTVGVWDGGAARATHQEFAGASVTVRDGAASIDHATHVSGTIGAAGVVASAKGMAPSVAIDSYDWNSDKTEMTARAATAPGQAGMLYMSNHSYGIIVGWNYVGGGGSPARVWEWNGDGATATAADFDFGRYNTYARDSDALAHNASYYLIFRSAGNDRVDNPSTGDTVGLSPGSATVVSYDASLHPKGDGSYLGGYGTVSFDALAKNVITVGSVTDAVSGATRDVARAFSSSFSAWGPTDDGRVKPDVVANGDGVYSSLNGGDASYGTYSGTSMATPNAMGTAALLFEDYARLFSGGAMRASTLKGLLIHTADDLGNPGPDYRHGWGLIDGQAASDLIRDHAAAPLKRRITEGALNAANPTANIEFVWDGVSPIRATLVWTDPAGAATTTNDLRTARLVNNLDLRVVGPTGAIYQPYVMPFVGTWTQAAADLPAATGQNNTDNVEQVYLAAPPAAGVYRAVVSLTGSLTGTEQRYSLLLTGAANQTPPPPALRLDSVAPAASLPGVANVTLAGVGFQSGVGLRLRRAGQADIVASNVQFSSTSLSGRFDLAGAAPGVWDLVATNTGGETATLAASFTVQPAIWCETFDGTPAGWSSAASIGSNAWSLSTAQSHSPSTSYFAPAPSSRTTASLASPVVAIPAGATGLQLKFWHRHAFNNGDAGRLELSVDGGATWFDVTDAGSGASFAANGYNGTVSSSGPASGRNEFAGKSAWTGTVSAFAEVVVNLADTAKFAGKNFRARWRIATNSSTASTGWHVDSVSLSGVTGPVDAPPVIVTAAAAATGQSVTDPDGTVFAVVADREAALSLAASDDGGEAALVYTWSAASAGGAPVAFSPNGTNAAKAALATFEAAGDYVIVAQARDSAGLAVSSTLNVRVVPVADALTVSPAVASVTVGGARAFAATMLDQFGEPLATQPSGFAWSVGGGGAVSSTGVFTATAAGGPYVVAASSGGFGSTAVVTVNRAEAGVALGNLSQIADGAARVPSVTTTPAGLAVSLTYDGGSLAPTAPGSYSVEAVVADPNYQGTASGILVVRSGFAAWAEAAGLTGPYAAPAADPDGDGAVNLLEYATGADPRAPGASPVSVVVRDGRLALVFPRVADPLLIYTVEGVDDLTGVWQTVATAGNPSAGSAATADIATVVDDRPLASAPRRFLRLRVGY